MVTKNKKIDEKTDALVSELIDLRDSNRNDRKGA